MRRCPASDWQATKVAQGDSFVLDGLGVTREGRHVERRLREEISRVVLGRDVFHDNFPRSYKFAHLQVAALDVAGALARLEVTRQLEGAITSTPRWSVFAHRGAQQRPAVTSCSCRCSRHSARRRFAATPPIPIICVCESDDRHGGIGSFDEDRARQRAHMETETFPAAEPPAQVEALHEEIDVLVRRAGHLLA